MKVGSLVRETIGGYVGVVVDIVQDGWLVHFPEYNCIFHMEMNSLELVDDDRNQRIYNIKLLERAQRSCVNVGDLVEFVGFEQYPKKNMDTVGIVI